MSMRIIIDSNKNCNELIETINTTVKDFTKNFNHFNKIEQKKDDCLITSIKTIYKNKGINNVD